MRPEIALAGRFPYDDNEMRLLYEQWLEAYDEIAEEHPSVNAMAEKLSERIKRAYELYGERERRLAGCTDCLEKVESDPNERERIKNEDTSLDGEFLLGNGKDMDFALRYFSVYELALIQLGLGHNIDLEKTAKNVPADLIRKGFLHEIKGEWREAVKAYRTARISSSGVLFDRINECRVKAKAKRERCPKCGGTDITNTAHGGISVHNYRENTSIVSREEWLCSTCGEAFSTSDDVYFCVKLMYRYKYDNEGRTATEEGEDLYELRAGAKYPLPYMHGSSLEIYSVSLDGETVTATLRAGGDTVTVSENGEPAYAYASGEYSVFGDSVHEGLSMSLTVVRD